MKVLVTGAGGPAGVAVIRALRVVGHTVLAVDNDPLAAGIRLADCGGVVPGYEDPHYVDALVDLAEPMAIDVMVPTLAEEMSVLSRSLDRLDDADIATYLAAPAAVERCIDKWQFARALDAATVPSPRTELGAAPEIDPPWVVKPRRGRGSRDVVVVDDPAELSGALARVPDPIVQERLLGREFTVDALVGRDGRVAGAVPRWRLETRGGISTKGVTFSDDAVARVIADALGAVGLTGPANVQGFVADDGRVAVTEVNPRFSGGLPLSLAAGADLVGEYLRMAMGQEPRAEALTHRDGVTMIRYFDEVFEG